jgi:hypothetical protein
VTSKYPLLKTFSAFSSHQNFRPIQKTLNSHIFYVAFMGLLDRVNKKISDIANRRAANTSKSIGLLKDSKKTLESTTNLIKKYEAAMKELETQWDRAMTEEEKIQAQLSINPTNAALKLRFEQTQKTRFFIEQQKDRIREQVTSALDGVIKDGQRLEAEVAANVAESKAIRKEEAELGPK